MNIRGKFKMVGRVAVVATAGVLLSTMTPASAAGTGATTGSSNIEASGPVSTPLCIRSNASPEIVLNNVGTVEVGAGVYAGATQATITLAQFWFGPEAVWPSAGCSAPGTIDVTAATITSTSPNAGSVSCGLGADIAPATSEYSRVTNAFVITATVDCTVTGPTGVTDSGTTTFVFSGNQNACLGDFGVPNCEDPLNETEFEGGYTQAP